MAKKTTKQKEWYGITIYQRNILIPVIGVLFLFMLPELGMSIATLRIHPVGAVGALFGMLCFIFSPYWVLVLYRSIKKGNIGTDKHGRMRIKKWKQ